MPTPENLVQKIRQREAALRSEFNRKKAVYMDIRDFIAPHTARFEGEQVHEGVRQDTNIINTEVRDAERTLPSGMQSGITSPMRPWFRLGTPDPDLQDFQPVKEWLNTVQRLMLEVFGRSNLYDRLKSNYGILGNYGTSCLFIDEDPDKVVRAHDLLFGSFLLATDANGTVNTLYRNTTMTATQLVERAEMRGWRMHSMAKQQYDNANYEQRFNILHVVQPNPSYRPDSELSRFKKYVSMWIDQEKTGREAILHMSGYDDIPMMGSRWDVFGEDVWGVGCGERALGDSKGLQLLEKRSYQILDKIANPPMVADASLRNQRVSNLPNSTTYVNGMVSGRPGYAPAYQIGNAPIAAVDAKAMRIEDRINRAYFKNLFLMVAEIADQPNITATQINAMREEKLLMLGPVLERLNGELLDPMIDRVFSIMMRNNMLPPPPPELEGSVLKVEYISVLAQAQKAIGIGNIERYVGFVGQMAQFDPNALDRLNIDETIEEYADGVAVPPRMVRSLEDAGNMREQRAQAQSQQVAMEQAAAGASAAKDLSQADMSGDNALAAALQTAGVPA